MFKANKIFYPAVLTVGGVYYHRVWPVLMIMIFWLTRSSNDCSLLWRVTDRLKPGYPTWLAAIRVKDKSDRETMTCPACLVIQHSLNTGQRTGTRN